MFAKKGNGRFGCNEAHVIQVIETTTLEGAGTPEDPAYLYHEYWSLDGKLLATSGIPSG